MPTYDYICPTCNNVFEYFQSMSDDPLTECPVCKGPVKRKIGAGSRPIFKGTGFYQTDYKNKSSKSDTTKSGGTANPESKPESKPETKPDSTPPPKTDTESK